MAVSRQSVTVMHEHGLHLRPCSLISQAAKKFACQIHVQKGDRRVAAIHLLDLLTLAAGPGEVLILEADGEDGDRALEELAPLFESEGAAMVTPNGLK